MTHDKPKPCEFPSLDSCQKGFLWVKKESNLGLHPVFGLVLPVREVGFSQAFGLKTMDLFSESTNRVYV